MQLSIKDSFSRDCDWLTAKIHGMRARWQESGRSAMIGAGSITESGCRESQLPKNSPNMYAGVEGEEKEAEILFKWDSAVEVKRTAELWGCMCVLWSVPTQGYRGLWAKREREGRRGNSSRMCTVTAVWITNTWRAEPREDSRGQSSLRSRSRRKSDIQIYSHQEESTTHMHTPDPQRTSQKTHRWIVYSRFGCPGF